MIKSNNKIAILMATFNGEIYIEKQINSIFSQTYKNFDLIICDDGSKDNTCNIIRKFMNNNKNIIFLKNTSSKHGQLRNFSFLFSYAVKQKKYDYIMFSDQDDIWFSKKLKCSLDLILKRKSKPTLLYTNYIVYDQNKGSHEKAYNIQYKESFESIFVQNWLMGCTMMMNKQMIDEIGSIPLNVDNHDYWIALIASLNNNIVYLDQATMIHRLHANNVTTKAQNNVLKSKLNKIYNIIFNKQYRKSKYIIWYNIKKMLSKKYDNIHIDNLNLILNQKRFSSIKEAKRLGFKGMNKMSTLAFFMMLYLH
ncbi:glycosyltransferase [Limosilactobacillus reuteri]|uniref:glycosyltransferase n=1 Tax=Limosilactobacillus reuteri TaxID=1598 RepID=UPI00143D8376|nr:glycosyltransferase [Limosilactobacillus reuteri]QIZ04501.1 glycosyltransferase [Limosilactobacillus reuteri]